MRQKRPTLLDALEGRFEAHHRFVLQTQLARMDELDGHIATLEQRIDEKLNPYREQHTRLMQIPGVNWGVAATIIAKLGVDMSVFGSVESCAAWVGVCPGNHESAGKRKKVRARQGNEHLTTALVEAAQAAAWTKRTYLRDKFYRLKAHIGYGKAIVAIAHKILIAVYHMLQAGTDYRELGETYLDQRDQKRLTQRLVRRLEGLGYHVRLAEREDVSAEEAALPLTADVATTPVGLPAASTIATRAPTPAPPQSAPPPRRTDTAATGSPAPAPAPASQATTPTVAPASSAISQPAPASRRADAVATPLPVPAPSPQAARATAAPRMPWTPTRRNARRPHARPSAAQTARNPSRPTPPPRDRARRTGAAHRDPRLPPVGHILRRSYQGVEHHVHIHTDGFEYRGQRYASLSRIAQVITGTVWNGFRFFGLGPRPSSAV